MTVHNFFMREWRNWQTRKNLGSCGLKTVEVQVVSPEHRLYRVPRKREKIPINTGDLSFRCEVHRGKVCHIREDKMCQSVPDF
jgi:hypothetical protein